MKISERLFYFLVIMSLIIISAFLGNKPAKEVEKIKTEFVYDTTEVIVEKVIKQASRTTTDTFFVEKYISSIDTTKCCDSLKTIAYDLYSTNEYSEVLKDDTTAFISVFSVVNGNELKRQVLTYKNRMPTQINTFIPNYKIEVFGGVEATTNGGVGVGLMFKHNKTYYGISYSSDGVVGVRAYIPLLKK